MTDKEELIKAFETMDSKEKIMFALNTLNRQCISHRATNGCSTCYIRKFCAYMNTHFCGTVTNAFEYFKESLK